MLTFAVDDCGRDRLAIEGSSRSETLSIRFDGREVASGPSRDYAAGRRLALAPGIEVEVRWVRRHGIEVWQDGRRLSASSIVSYAAAARSASYFFHGAAAISAAVALLEGLRVGLDPARGASPATWPPVVVLATLAVAQVGLAAGMRRGSLACAWGGLAAVLASTGVALVCEQKMLIFHILAAVTIGATIRGLRAARSREADLCAPDDPVPPTPS